MRESSSGVLEDAMISIGEAATIWTIRSSTLLYVAALLSLLLGRESRARVLWSAGLLFYLAHVVLAFHTVHDWSHSKAALETARQTEELVGVASGAGLWINYVFTVVWIADALWWWIDPPGYRLRPRWIAIATQAFLAFLFFNGTVVFGEGISRWIGIAATPPLLFLWLRSRFRSRARC